MDKPIDEAVIEAGLRAAADASDARLPRYKVVRAIIEAALTAAQQPDHLVDANKMVAQQQGQAVMSSKDRRAMGWPAGDTAPPSAPLGVEGLVVAARKLRDSARGMDDGSRWVPGTVFKQFSKAVTAALATQHQEPKS